MMYADYDYYINSFLCGKEASIPETEFQYYAVKATAQIRNVIRLDMVDEQQVIDEVKKAMCDVAEKIYSYSSMKTNSAVTSEKVGEYSVSYASRSDLEKEEAKAISDSIVSWLGVTGLLFRGIYVH